MPRPRAPPRGAARDRQHVAHRLVEPGGEEAAQALALERIVEPGVERIDVHRQLVLAPQVIEDVLVGREDALGIEPEPLGHAAEEAPRQGLVRAARGGLVGEERGVAPERLAVAAPERVERPARQRLARVPLALPEMNEPARRVLGAQAVEEIGGEALLVRPERRGVPLLAVGIVDGDERRLAAHRQAHVARAQRRVDGVAEGLDLRPLGVGVRLGHARRLPHARHRHLVLEGGLALGDEPAHRRRGGRLRRASERQMPFTREEPRGRIEPDPARAGQVHLAPGVEIDEVLGRPRRPVVERLGVGLELHEVARDEARREAEAAEDLREEPGGVAARSRALLQRLLRRLQAGLEADHIANVPRELLVELDEEIVGGAGLARDGGDEGVEERRARRERSIRSELGLQRLLVLKGPLLGVRLEEEVERVDHRHFGDDVDLDSELGRGLREDEASEVVGLGILLPVDEVLLGQDLERITEDARATVRRRPQPDDLRAERDRPVVAVGGDVVDGYVDRHRSFLGARRAGEDTARRVE